MQVIQGDIFPLMARLHTIEAGGGGGQQQQYVLEKGHLVVTEVRNSTLVTAYQLY